MPLHPPDVRAFQASLAPIAQVPMETPDDWRKRAAVVAGLEAETRNRDAMARANAVEAKQRERAMAEADAMQRIAQESGGDWDVMIERATALNPTLGATLTEQRGKAQQATAKAFTEQLTAEKQRTERGRMFLEVAKNDPEFYDSMVGSIAAMLPEELRAALPPKHDPARIAALLDATADAGKRMERAGQLHDKVLSGDAFKGVLGQLAEQDTEEEWNGVINTYAAFLPKGTLALLPKWGPDAQAKAAAMAMTPDQRADNARLAEAAAATAAKDTRDFTALERHRRATEGHAAATERRLSTQAATGGAGGTGDIAEFADAYMGGDTSVLRGLTPSVSTKVRAEILRRGGTLPAAAAADGKPPTGAERKVFGFFERLQQADEELALVEGEIAALGTSGQLRLKAPDFFQTPIGRRYMQARRAFTESDLRRASGAAISTGEYTDADKRLFIQPGDDPETQAQKRRARARVLASTATESGRAFGEFFGDSADAMMAAYRTKAMPPKGQAGSTTAPATTTAPAAAAKPREWRYNLTTGKQEEVK